MQRAVRVLHIGVKKSSRSGSAVWASDRLTGVNRARLQR
jgi:hypothetical protein